MPSLLLKKLFVGSEPFPGLTRNRKDSLVVEDVTVSEAERGSTRVQVVPLVVRICHLNRRVLALVAVRVSDQRSLPVIMQIRVRDRDGVDTVSEIKQAIVVILVMVAVGPELDVVNPNAVGRLDGEGVAGIGENFVDLQGWVG